MDDTPIDISRIHFPIKSLGPGLRIGIWLQGCSIRCPGCISLDTWATGRGKTTVERVVQAIEPWLDRADGFTISGGEPFDQPRALFHLLQAIRSRHEGDILVYSGHPLEALPIGDFSGLIDSLISDPLLIDQPQTLPLRGSDNQRLHLLTSLGRNRFQFARAAGEAMPSTLDIMFDDARGDVFLAGVPRRGDLVRLQEILEAAGHSAGITEDKQRYR